MGNEKKKRNPLKKVLLIISIVLLALICTATIYLSNYNTGDERCTALLNSPSAGVTVIENDNTIAFVPENDCKTGIIIYPGAKITADAYTPLADALASNGYLCVLVDMPLNLALLDSDVALDVKNCWPDINNWYIAGHSMGGYAAEKCFYNNPDSFNGLIVMAAKINYDFSNTDNPTLFIYATNDGICTTEGVADAKEMIPLPKDYSELMIEGGCHGYFGSYGPQVMDGTPTISWESQQEQTLDSILKFVKDQKQTIVRTGTWQTKEEFSGSINCLKIFITALATEKARICVPFFN